MELRTNTELRVEARAAGEGVYLDGYAALFGAPTIIWDFEEVIAPGAFNRALGENQEVRALFNHDPNYPLARTKNGTLILREDGQGLWTESKLSSNPTSDSIADYVRTGLVSGMSFAFTVRKQEWVFQEIGSDKLDRRVITEVGQLYDIGPVTYPASEQTSIKMREAARKLHDEARSRWEGRRSTFQVPQGFELVCREARGAGNEEAWESDELDHEFREVFKEEGQAVEESLGGDSGDASGEEGCLHQAEAASRDIDIRRRRGLAIL